MCSTNSSTTPPRNPRWPARTEKQNRRGLSPFCGGHHPPRMVAGAKLGTVPFSQAVL
jgi:hypothetical protein